MIVFVDSLRPGDAGWQNFVDWADANEAAAIERLPARFRELSAAIGVAAVMTLLRGHGGHDVFLSERPRAHSRAGRIAADMGAAGYATLLAAFGPGRLDLPTGRAVIYVYRDYLVSERIADGATASSLATQFGLCTRTVIRARARAGDTTPPARRGHGGGAPGDPEP